MLSLERADGTRRVGLISLIGLLLVPLVVAAGFLAATWNSTDRLDRVQAAVVNLDEPVRLQGQTVPLGRQLAGGLVNGGDADDDETNFSWLLTDADDGRRGLEAGRYAAVVTIPEDFSANATSYSDQSGDTAEQATLDVQTSQVSGISDPVVGQAITAAATRALNSTLTESYLQNIYVGFNTTKEQFTKVADAADELADGTRGLADGLEKTSDGTAGLAEGLAQLDDGGGQLASGASQLSTGTAQLADGLDTFANQTAGLPKGARQLADGAAGLSSGLKTYQSALRQQADKAGDAKQPAAPSEESLGRALAAALAAQPTPEAPTLACPQTQPALTADQCAAVLQFAGGLSQQAGEQAGQQAAGVALAVAGQQFGAYAPKLAEYAGQQGAAKALDGAADGLSQKDPETKQSLRSGLAGLADGADELADGLPAVTKGLRSTADGAAELASGAEGLSSGVTEYTGGVSATADGAEQLSTGVIKLAAGGDKLADGTEQLADGLATGAEEVPTYDKSTRERLSQVAAAPVTTPEVDSVFSNVTTTTLLAVLALWLGGLASFLVLRPISARALSSMQPSWRLTLGSLVPAAAIAAVQALALGGLLGALLDLSAGQTVRVLGLGLLAALTFVALNHALAAWFGGVGRFVSVVLLVLTVAGALTSALPAFFDSVTPLLPLTPALQGLRAIAAGAEGAGGSAGLLLAWLLVGLAAGLLAVARHRVAAPAKVRSGLVPAVVR